MQVDVIDIKKKKVGKVELPDDVFAIEVKDTIVWEQVKAQLASRRRGTHKTKKRGEVSGGGIKPFKQKGTGRARQGSSRAPNHVGGGKVFGPVPRDYSYRLPRSARRAALRSVLSLRAKDEGVMVVDKIVLTEAKTRALNEILKTLGVENALIIDIANDQLKLSARNLTSSKYLVPEALNVYDVLRHEKLILTQGVIDAVVARARKGDAKASA